MTEEAYWLDAHYLSTLRMSELLPLPLSCVLHVNTHQTTFKLNHCSHSGVCVCVCDVGLCVLKGNDSHTPLVQCLHHCWCCTNTPLHLTLHFGLTHERASTYLNSFAWGSNSLQQRTMVSDLELLILIPTASHSVQTAPLCVLKVMVWISSKKPYHLQNNGQHGCR